MRVEVLYVDGCRNCEALLPRLRELLDRAGLTPEVALRRVDSEQDARRLGFLGSPTVRVNGRDVEPGANERDDFGLGCRLYRTPDGLAGAPPSEWIAAALAITLDGPLGGTITARLRDLPGGDRELHRSVLRAFLDGHAPDGRDIRRRASELDVDLDAALAELERRGALWVDRETGAVRVAYPFSGVPTVHEVTIVRTGARAFAMCAVDALGIPFMAGEPTIVRSRDPIGGEPIQVSIDPAGSHSWDPAATTVIAAVAGGGPSATACCPHVNFVAYPERARAPLTDRAAARGAMLEMVEAIELGRRVFGSLLEGG